MPAFFANTGSDLVNKLNKVFTDQNEWLKLKSKMEKFKNIYTSFKENIKVFHWPSDDKEEWVVHPVLPPGEVVREVVRQVMLALGVGLVDYFLKKRDVHGKIPI